jgi:hypothetical protein
LGPVARSVGGIVDRWVRDSSMISLRSTRSNSANPRPSEDASYGNIFGRFGGLVQSILPVHGRGNALATSLLVNQLCQRGQLFGRAEFPFLKRPSLGAKQPFVVAAAKGL